MENLSLNTLRKIILEEIQKILQDDALFSRDELTDVGTGTIVGLSSLDDEDDWASGYDAYSTCDVCGGEHDIELPCG